MRDYTYYSVARRSNDQVYLVLREWTYEVCRWIPHLNEWVEMPECVDYLSGGHSSGNLSLNLRKISKDEAEALFPDVYDLPDEWVEKGRARYHRQTGPPSEEDEPAGA